MPNKQMSIAAISEQVSAESRGTEDTADWISHATEIRPHTTVTLILTRNPNRCYFKLWGKLFRQDLHLHQLK